MKHIKPENTNTKSFYVDKKRLNAEILTYHNRLAYNPNERIPEYVGECILAICKGVARSHQFNSQINQQYRDEMIANAALVCVNAIKKIDPSLGTSSFSYLTTTAQRSFLWTISKEKDFAYTKFKSLVSYYDSFASDEELDDYVDDRTNEISTEIESNKSEYLNRLRNQISDYDKSLVKKREMIRKKATKLEEFFDEGEPDES